MNVTKMKNLFSNNNKEIKVSEFIYLLAFGIYLIYAVICTTMFSAYIPRDLKTLMRVSAIVLIIFKLIVFDRYNLRQILNIIIVAGVLIFASYKSGYAELFDLSFLIIGAKDVDLNKIVKLSLYITTCIVTLAMIASKLGIIENLVYYRNNKMRNSFGCVYCTDFAAHIFYILCSYFYLKYEKVSMKHVAVYILLAYFVLTCCGARMDTICITLMAVFMCFMIIKKKRLNKKNKSFKLNKLSRLFIVFSVPLAAVISMVTTMKYTNTNPYMVKLNNLLSSRLSLGLVGIRNYGFKMFGQQVELFGNGGNTIGFFEYFFIDCSYLYIALLYGTVVLFLFLFYSIMINRKALKVGNIMLTIIFVFIAIDSMVEHHFVSIAYNPFILSFFASIDKCNDSFGRIKNV